MNEVEKMYRNAKIDYEERYNDCTLDMEGECHLNIHCDLCNYSKEKYIYPPFTAEKQIAILNFCLKWGQVHLLRGIDDEYRIENCCYRQGYQPTIADAIANYINEKWEKLTPEERKQIKEILE